MSTEWDLHLVKKVTDAIVTTNRGVAALVIAVGETNALQRQILDELRRMNQP